MVTAADGAATACCNSTAVAALRGPSLAAIAVLPAARGALDERRLVGTTVSDLNTLAGVRGRHGGCHPANVKMRNQASAFRRHASGGVLAYLRVEKPRFLFLGGSAGVVAAADVATAAPLVASTARAGTLAARAGASVARAASLTGRLATGAPAPAQNDISSTTSTALGEGGAGSHLSGRARPPSLSSSSSSDDEYSEVAGEESPCCSRS
jgi:hypothetical protein